jgi:diacylglycerol kinase (ATP)
MDQNDWYIIVNPAGGYGKVSRRWPELERLLREAGIRFEAVQTEGRGHATELAREAIESGRRHIIAVGGDGTNNETINGILAQKAAPTQEIVYGLVPVGAGNDWVRTLGIPVKFPAWIEMLKKGHTRLVDVGLAEFSLDGGVHRRHFANVAGMAFDAYVAQFMNEKGRVIHGRFAYLLALARCLAWFKLPRARVSADGFLLEDFCYTVNAGICRYSGGGMQLVPHAVPDDGLLALTVAKKLSKFGVLLATPYFYNGKIERHPKVETYSAPTIRVEALEGSAPIGLEADGEFMGFTPVAFSLVEKALQTLVPEHY